MLVNGEVYILNKMSIIIDDILTGWEDTVNAVAEVGELHETRLARGSEANSTGLGAACGMSAKSSTNDPHWMNTTYLDKQNYTRHGWREGQKPTEAGLAGPGGCGVPWVLVMSQV